MHGKRNSTLRSQYLLFPPLQIYVVRLNPFYTGTGACLFTWAEHAKVLTRGPFEFRIVTASKTAPEAYSSLQVCVCVCVCVYV